MSELYSIGFDLSTLEKALKMSEKIKANLSSFSLKDGNFKAMSDSFKEVIKENPYEQLNKAFKDLKTSDFAKGFEDLNKAFKELSKNDFSKSFTDLNKAFEDLKGSKEFNDFSKSFEDLKNSPTFKKLDKAFDGFNDDLAKGNKALKEQNKLLNNSYQKMNLMKMAGSKLKAGFLGLGGLALGGAAGLLGGAVNGYNGTLSTQLRAKNVGLSIGEHDALAYAGKMTGLGEDTLISAIEGLTTSMEDFDKWGNFASLGLNASDLQKKNPTEALFEVLESMKDSDLPQYLKKQIIDDIGIPFDNFRFVLKEGTGEIEKFFKEGFELNKNNDKYAKGEWVKNEKTGEMEKTKGLIDAERETIRFTENFGGMMKHISYDIAPPYIDGMKQITDLLPKLEDTISKSIMWGIDFVKGFAETPEEDRAKYISQELWKPLGDMLGGVFESGLKSMTDSLKEQFKPLVDGWEDLKGAFKSPKAFFEYFFTNDKELSANPEISETFKKKGVGLSSYGNMINAYLAGDQQQNYIVSLLEALKNQELSKNEAKTFRGFFNDKKWENDYGITKDFFDNYKQKQVNDAIITPNNQLITTSPKDYIFAMKRPEDLAAAGSSSSKGSNYTITINNPIVRNDGDIRKLKTQLEQLIKSFNSKR
ncbi:hypothetical protein [Brachyspira hyodysenteriae]|uniref:hypothetical protein n=2 Tax=Brachyspira hyodysenteriae TaxID=159 RepID=UPI00063D9AB6|nr:hypothetical protein [Brachyspira hyodysenteriae]KLI56958.1 hypothetical protein SZ44_12595 [Brachyspira hyodysenteriae]